MNGAVNERSDTGRLLEAAAWRTRLWESGRDSTPEFARWLSDPANRRAWDRVQRGWDILAEHATAPELLELRRRALERVHASGRRRWATRSRPINRLGAAAAVLLLSVAGAITFHLTGADVYRTGIGERRVVTLADGSRVQLDSSTELRVDYTKQARDLQLIEGQARFDVAHEVERPFHVIAAGRKVVAVGTVFNVDLVGNDLFVTLLEGKVVVVPQAAEPDVPEIADLAFADRAEPEVPAKRAAPHGKTIALKAGEQLAVSADGTPMVAPASVERATAWENGRLVFEDEPLSTVVARLNRYAARRLVLSDDVTASLRISGVFNAGDVDSFVATVTYYLPVKAESGDDAVYLSARAARTNFARMP